MIDLERRTNYHKYVLSSQLKSKIPWGRGAYLIQYRRYLKSVYRQKGWKMKTREWDILSQILQDKEVRIMQSWEHVKNIDKLKNETG